MASAEGLVSVARDGEGEGKAYAAGALMRILKNADNTVAIVRAGGIPVLVSMLEYPANSCSFAWVGKEYARGALLENFEISRRRRRGGERVGGYSERHSYWIYLYYNATYPRVVFEAIHIRHEQL